MDGRRRPRRIDIVGRKYGNLTVLSFSRLKDRKTYWECVCACGGRAIVRSDCLKDGNTKSCGCATGNLKHGMNRAGKRSRFYKIWDGMHQRCYNKNKDNYAEYGGRGIRVEWRDFLQFKKDMYDSYAEHTKQFGERNTTIDRIDGDGNYSKTNCRWATPKIQAINRKTTTWITFNKKTLPLSDWARLYKRDITTLRRRLNNGVSIKHALECQSRMKY